MYHLQGQQQFIQAELPSAMFTCIIYRGSSSSFRQNCLQPCLHVSFIEVVVVHSARIAFSHVYMYHLQRQQQFIQAELPSAMFTCIIYRGSSSLFRQNCLQPCLHVSFIEVVVVHSGRIAFSHVYMYHLQRQQQFIQAELPSAMFTCIIYRGSSSSFRQNCLQPCLHVSFIDVVVVYSGRIAFSHVYMYHLQRQQQFIQAELPSTMFTCIIYRGSSSLFRQNCLQPCLHVSFIEVVVVYSGRIAFSHVYMYHLQRQQQFIQAELPSAMFTCIIYRGSSSLFRQNCLQPCLHVSFIEVVVVYSGRIAFSHVYMYHLQRQQQFIQAELPSAMFTCIIYRGSSSSFRQNCLQPCLHVSFIEVVVVHSGRIAFSHVYMYHLQRQQQFIQAELPSAMFTCIIYRGSSSSFRQNCLQPCLHVSFIEVVVVHSGRIAFSHVYMYHLQRQQQFIQAELPSAMFTCIIYRGSSSSFRQNCLQPCLHVSFIEVVVVYSGRIAFSHVYMYHLQRQQQFIQAELPSAMFTCIIYRGSSSSFRQNCLQPCLHVSFIEVVVVYSGRIAFSHVYMYHLQRQQQFIQAELPSAMFTCIIYRGSSSSFRQNCLQPCLHASFIEVVVVYSGRIAFSHVYMYHLQRQQQFIQAELPSAMFTCIIYRGSSSSFRQNCLQPCLHVSFIEVVVVYSGRIAFSHVYMYHLQRQQQFIQAELPSAMFTCIIYRGSSSSFRQNCLQPCLHASFIEVVVVHSGRIAFSHVYMYHLQRQQQFIQAELPSAMFTCIIYRGSSSSFRQNCLQPCLHVSFIEVVVVHSGRIAFSHVYMYHLQRQQQFIQAELPSAMFTCIIERRSNYVYT